MKEEVSAEDFLCFFDVTLFQTFFVRLFFLLSLLMPPFRRLLLPVLSPELPAVIVSTSPQSSLRKDSVLRKNNREGPADAEDDDDSKEALVLP